MHAEPTPKSPSAPNTSTAPSGPSAAPNPSVVTPLLASVIAAPIPVPATDGKVHLAYELQLTNVLDQDVTLTSVDVLDRDIALLNLTGDQLALLDSCLRKPRRPQRNSDPRRRRWCGSTSRWTRAPRCPRARRTRSGCPIAQPQPPLFPATMTETVAPVTVQTRKPVVDHAAAVGTELGGRQRLLRHERAPDGAQPINGQLWAAERFAIDYVQLFRTTDCSPATRPSRRAIPISAPTSTPWPTARWSRCVDGLPEQVPGTSPTGLPLDQYAGNHIVQDLGDGNYALYAHLKTGTVKVKPGDRLTSGQVIGSLGNTGNTDGATSAFPCDEHP